jgi:hypothetical protein
MPTLRRLSPLLLLVFATAFSLVAAERYLPTSSVAAQAALDTWNERSPTISPDAPWGAALAYDAARNVTVLFGGSTGSLADDSNLRNDTWTWNGASWARLSPPRSPSPRFGASMVFDSARGVVVLFGGRGAGLTALGDTWTWNGSTWTQQAPTLSPPARLSAGLAYDSSRSVTVLFGGHNIQAAFGDTWAYNGSTWTQLNPASAPTGRNSAALADDAAHGQLVLFGGFDNGGNFLDDTWSWNGTNWLRRSPPTSPTPRYSASMAFDSVSQTVLLFGGIVNGPASNETWKWNGSTWVRLDPPTAPVGRGFAGLVNDTTRRELVLFGGYNNSLLGDTWTWASSPSTSRLAFTQQPPPSATVGQTFPVTVWVQDAGGNLVTSDNMTVVMLSKGPSSTGAGNLRCAGGLSKTVVNGTASFTGCRFDQVGTYNIRANGGTLTPATSTAVTVTSAASRASKLAFTHQPSTKVVAGQILPTQPRIAVQDTNGTVVTSDNTTVVTLDTVAGNRHGLSCSGGLSRTVVSGIAEFSGCAFSQIDLYGIRATSRRLTPTDTVLIAVSSPPPPTGVLQLPWPFDERSVSIDAWHNHDTPGRCSDTHTAGHPGTTGDARYPCGYGDLEGDHESDDAYAQDWNFGGGSADLGKRVLNVIAGTVLYADDTTNCYGKQVIVLSTDRRYAIRYTHLQTITVQQDTPIAVGTPVGTVGGTCGRGSISPHLHVAVYTNIDDRAIRRLSNGSLPCGRGPLRDDTELISATNCAQPFRFNP